MKPPTVSLAALLHRLTDCPADFLENSRVDGGTVHTEALVADTLVFLGADPIAAQTELALNLSGSDLNHRKIAQVVCWLLNDPFFAGHSEWAGKVSAFLQTELATLAPLVPAEQCVTDPDRREELARRLLRALAVSCDGETPAQAQDRLTSLDSVELHRVLEETEEAQKRRKKVMDALRKRAAEEAAAKVTRE